MSGYVGVLSQAITRAVTITRSANTTVYPANSVIGGAQQLLNFGPGGSELYITSGQLQIFDTALILGEGAYNLYLYNVTPPSALADNVAFDIPAGDRSAYIGKISLGSPVDEGSTLIVDVDSIFKQITLPASGNLFFYLVTVGGYIPTSGRVYVPSLKGVPL